MQLGPTPSFFVHLPPDVWILQLQLLPCKVAIGDQTRGRKWFWMKHCIFGIIKGISYIWQHKEPEWPTWNEIRSKFTPVLSLPPRFAIGRAKAKPRWGCTFASLEANPFLTPKKYESMHEQTYFLKRRTSVDSFCWPRTGLWPNPFWTASTPKFPGSQCCMKMVIHNSASKSNKVVYRFIQLGYLCTHAAKTSVYVWSVQTNAKRPGSVLPEIFPWFWEHQLHPASPPPSACGYLQVWRLHIAWYGCAKAFLVQSGQHINDGTKFQTILQWLRFIDSYAHLNIHNLHVDPIIQYVTLRSQNIKTTFKKIPPPKNEEHVWKGKMD